MNPESWNGILKLFRIPGIDSKESIPPAYVAELEFLNFYEAQESIQGSNSAGLCSLAVRYNNPIPTWFLSPIEF